MKDAKTTSGGEPCAGPLTLQLTPELSEYLRREAASQAIDAVDLACRLLMRGLQAERFDEVAANLASHEGACATSNERRLTADLEAGALLGAFPALRRAAEGPGRQSREAAAGTMREVLERASTRRSR